MLIFEIAYGASQVCYPVDLDLTFRLVINTHLDAFALSSHRAAGVSGVSHIDLLLIIVDVDDVGRATDRVKHHFFLLIFTILVAR